MLLLRNFASLIDLFFQRIFSPPRHNALIAKGLSKFRHTRLRILILLLSGRPPARRGHAHEGRDLRDVGPVLERDGGREGGGCVQA